MSGPPDRDDSHPLLGYCKNSRVIFSLPFSDNRMSRLSLVIRHLWRKQVFSLKNMIPGLFKTDPMFLFVGSTFGHIPNVHIDYISYLYRNAILNCYFYKVWGN